MLCGPEEMGHPWISVLSEKAGGGEALSVKWVAINQVSLREIRLGSGASWLKGLLAALLQLELMLEEDGSPKQL